MNADEIVKKLRCTKNQQDNCKSCECAIFMSGGMLDYCNTVKLESAAADLIERQQATLNKAKVAFREKRERDNPQPLTLEQLQQMDGQPVWCPTYGWGIVDTHFRKNKRISIVFARHWKIAQNVLLDGNEVYLSKPEKSEGD